jgi:hypothetical protein
MAVTQADLDRLLAAKHSGVMKVEQDGKAVTYRSMRELDMAITSVQRALGHTAARQRTSYADFS